MVGIVRIYHDSYGNNMGSRTFCQLSKYFGGVLITDNKKILELNEFKTLSHKEAVINIKKFTKILVYNSKPNMFGGIAPKFIHDIIRLVLGVKDVYFYNCDPILDLQLSVPDSHEFQAPGLTRCINKIRDFGTRLDRTNTDLTRFLAANIKFNPLPVAVDGKLWLSCYFGNARQKFRQDQVFNLLNPLDSKLIIGHEHPEFPWFDYTPNFYERLSTAWTTPIIGDQKLHYDTGIPSIRLYETWNANVIGLVDSRLKEPLLDDRFYFKTPEEFHQKTLSLALNINLYMEMVKHQQSCLKKLKKQYQNKKFDWSKIKKAKELIDEQRRFEVKSLKQNKIDTAKLRLKTNKLL